MGNPALTHATDMLCDVVHAVMRLGERNMRPYLSGSSVRLNFTRDIQPIVEGLVFCEHHQDALRTRACKCLANKVLHNTISRVNGELADTHVRARMRRARNCRFPEGKDPTTERPQKRTAEQDPHPSEKRQKSPPTAAMDIEM